MRHDFIDKYCHLHSPLHRLDPRGKLLFCLSFIFIVIATNNIKLFSFYYLLLITLVFISRVPVFYYIKRALLITPFVLLIAFFMVASAFFFPEPQAAPLNKLTHPVYPNVALIILKTYASIIILTTLTSVTRFNCLLWAMRKFKMPPVITTLSRLVYTYTFLLLDELHAAQRAVRSRAPVIRMPRTKVYGNIAASILLKSIHRSQVVYYAMVSRKFTGDFPEGESNRFRAADLIAAACFVFFVLGVYMLWTI